MSGGPTGEQFDIVGHGVSEELAALNRNVQALTKAVYTLASAAYLAPPGRGTTSAIAPLAAFLQEPLGREP